MKANLSGQREPGPSPPLQSAPGPRLQGPGDRADEFNERGAVRRPVHPRRLLGALPSRGNRFRLLRSRLRWRPGTSDYTCAALPIAGRDRRLDHFGLGARGYRTTGSIQASWPSFFWFWGDEAADDCLAPTGTRSIGGIVLGDLSARRYGKPRGRIPPRRSAAPQVRAELSERATRPTS